MDAPRTGEPPSAHADDSVGGRLRRARLERGVSLRALARTLDMNPATLSQLETGKSGVTVQRLQLIIEALGAEYDEVLSGRDESPGSSPTTSWAPAVSGVQDWRVYGPADLDPVLSAALQVFVATGYHGATVRDVARRCGLSVSGIYHHYDSKHDMLRTILEIGVTEMLRRAHAARAEGRDSVERFSLMIESLVLFHTYRRSIGFLGASEMRSLDPEVRRQLAVRRQLQQHMIDAEVVAAVAEGRFSTAHPRSASRAVVTMCTSVAQWFNTEGADPPGAVASRYVRFSQDLMGHPPTPTTSRT